MANPKDDRWRHLDKPWARLRWARLQKFGTGEDGATAVGMAGHTYRAYERSPNSSKHTPLTYEVAFHFANKFGIRWEWLMDGKGEPWPEASPLDRLKPKFEAATPAQQDAIVQAIEALLRTGTTG